MKSNIFMLLIASIKCAIHYLEHILQFYVRNMCTSGFLSGTLNLHVTSAMYLFAAKHQQTICTKFERGIFLAPRLHTRSLCGTLFACFNIVSSKFLYQCTNNL